MPNRPATLRFHLETNREPTPYNGPVPIYRANPIIVNVESDAVLEATYEQ